MNRYLCVHGHFYQPPRENPWLEAIEQQDSAYPYHDWNERINAESYGPNSEARILDERDRIIHIVNNYAHISFNFGPTLLDWMRAHARDTYEAVLEADRESVTRFGHGSALAQAYGHVIMPLSNDRDRRTQVLWGIRDFTTRFGRAPDGMWLPETAVDIATLEDLAAAGIRFTILAPNQAARVRRVGSRDWQDVSGARVDSRRPYLQRLPSGAEITLFFYDGPTSRAVAFEGLLRNGEHFAQRVLSVLQDGTEPQLATIATDGETYGHHHRHGEMALAYMLHHVEQRKLARITNYAAFLAEHPPEWEAQIQENTSWSCAHGLERWRSDCGCHTGGGPAWHQRWRQPLREALDWLRDYVNPLFEEAAAPLMPDPWAARDDYIDVVLDRRRNTLPFMARHGRSQLTQAEIVRVLELMELQRHAMLMYTSCGWFFNDISGIETVQVLQYAGRVVQLAEKLFDVEIEEPFLERLEKAESNVPEAQNGREIYLEHVVPARVDLLSVAAHYAVSSLFDNGESLERRIYCYDVELEQGDRRQSGETVLLVGRARVTSEITQESVLVTYAVLHFGSHNLTGGIRRFAGDEEFRALRDELLRAFSTADIAAVVRLLANFPEYSFSLKSLFGDRQRNILYRVLDSSLSDAERAYRRLYEDNASLMRFLISQDLPVPRAFTVAAEFVLNRDIRTALGDEPSLERARSLLDEAEATGIQLDSQGLSYVLERALERLAHAFLEHPRDIARLEKWAELASLTEGLPFDVNLWKTQNVFYELLHTVYPVFTERAEAGDESARRWIQLFTSLGAQLSVAVP